MLPAPIGALVVAALLATATPAHASTSRLLDVPFVSQPERLCGGAAAAMVLRYWGWGAVRPEEFAALVDEQAGGIRQSALAAAIRGRGLEVARLDVLPDTGEALAREIEHGRPVLALLEDRPGRYHYIVIVGRTDDAVIFHDPALTPFRVMDRAQFDRRWAAAAHWAIVAFPVPGTSRLVPGAEPILGAGCAGAACQLQGADDSCGRLVEQGVQLARDGHRDEAARMLEVAVDLCPGSAAAHVELAGLRFLDERWASAAALAERAAAIAPADAHTWRLLASSRFVEGDAQGALEAWNRAGEPRVDLVQVSGLVRTRHRIVEGRTAIRPGALLTPASLARARRRVAELPALIGSRVDYRPAPQGLANVEVAVVERPLAPTMVDVAGRAARAAVDREAAADIWSPTHSGERIRLAWRFWENRPAITVQAQAPSLLGLSGLWTIEGGWSRQPYSAGRQITTDEPTIINERRHAAISFADWLTGGTRIEAGAGVDRWVGRPASASARGAIEQRLFDDRTALRADAAIWPAAGGAFGSAAIRAGWRAGDMRSLALEARGGLDAATARAPLDLWEGAGAGHARTARLRAHPLIDDNGIIEGPVFGRRLAHAGVEASRTIRTLGPIALGAVAFADAARAWHTLSGDRRLHVDVGGGLRLRTISADGAIAVDIARGLRDGRTAITAGWVSSWPGW